MNRTGGGFSKINTKLFTRNNEPMQFSFDGCTVDEFIDTSNVIEVFGGQLVEPPKPGTIIFADRNRFLSGRHDRYDSQFIHDSIVAGKLQNLENYRIPPVLNRKLDELAKNSRTGVAKKNVEYGLKRRDADSSSKGKKNQKRTRRIVSSSDGTPTSSRNVPIVSSTSTTNTKERAPDIESSETPNSQDFQGASDTVDRNGNGGHDYEDDDDRNSNGGRYDDDDGRNDNDGHNDDDNNNDEEHEDVHDGIDYSADDEHEEFEDGNDYSDTGYAPEYSYTESDVNGTRKTKPQHQRNHRTQRPKSRMSPSTVIGLENIGSKRRRIVSTQAQETANCSGSNKNNLKERRTRANGWTEEEYQAMIDFLISNELIYQALGGKTWERCLQEAPFFKKSKRTSCAMRRQFVTWLRWNFAEYTNDPDALKHFANIQDHRRPYGHIQKGKEVASTEQHTPSTST